MEDVQEFLIEAKAHGCSPTEAAQLCELLDRAMNQLERMVIAHSDRAREDYSRRPQWALEACRELIEGEGDSASFQRAIDLARVALGVDAMPDTQPSVAFKKRVDQ